MGSDTPPQDSALPPKVDRAIDVIRELTGRKDERDEEIIHMLADAGLLSSSSGEKGEDLDVSALRSEPPATGEVQWAVLSFEDDSVYDRKATANRALSLLREDGEDGFRLYEIREVKHG